VAEPDIFNASVEVCNRNEVKKLAASIK